MGWRNGFCPRCKTQKPGEDWTQGQPYCRFCATEHARERYYSRKPDSANTLTEKRCLHCREVKQRSDFGTTGRAWYCTSCQDSRTQPVYYSSTREYRILQYLRNFNLTPEDYDELLARQNGGCAICGQVNDSGRRLSVDHDHSCCGKDKSCGKCVRGLLCFNCNVALGHFKDNPGIMENAIAYLASRNVRAVI